MLDPSGELVVVTREIRLIVGVVYTRVGDGSRAERPDCGSRAAGGRELGLLLCAALYQGPRPRVAHRSGVSGEADMIGLCDKGREGDMIGLCEGD